MAHDPEDQDILAKKALVRLFSWSLPQSGSAEKTGMNRFWQPIPFLTIFANIFLLTHKN